MKMTQYLFLVQLIYMSVGAGKILHDQQTVPASASARCNTHTYVNHDAS